MNQPHKQALNKYLITRPENEIYWNNETGSAYISNNVYKSGNDIILRNARVIKYGLLGNGGPDLIGITLTKITPDMIGHTIPIFSSIEMKQGKDRLRPAQKNWHRILTGYGCYSKVVYYDGKEFKEWH